MRMLAGWAALALAAPLSAQTEAEAPVYDEAWHNQQQLALAELRAEDGWQVLPGGLRWRRVAGDGTGFKPTVEDTVMIHYVGTFIDGTEFDSSHKRGQAATFPLSRLIKAWQMAVPEMGVGDTIEIYAPADLAYGPNGRGSIPGNATLKFTIELLAVPKKAL